PVISAISLHDALPISRQTGHLSCALPVPWQSGHSRLNFIRPPVWVTCPLPPQRGQAPDFPTNPFPLQLEQLSWRAISSRITVPRMASQKLTLTWYSRSEPGSGSLPAASAPRFPKMLEKMSCKPPPPPVRLAPPPVKPLKSNPPKSKGAPCLGPALPGAPKPPAPNPSPRA